MEERMHKKIMIDKIDALLRTYCCAWSHKKIMSDEEVIAFAQDVIVKSEQKTEEIQRALEELKRYLENSCNGGKR